MPVLDLLKSTALTSVSDPYSSNPDPDPDSAKNLNLDPDPVPDLDQSYLLPLSERKKNFTS